MSQYLAISKQKLASFLTNKIQSVDNPEQFERQMNREIQKVMKSQQRRLKQMRSKMKMKKLTQIATNEQEQLKKKLEDKLKIGADRKVKTLQARVQSLADLRSRKERCIALQREMQRRQSLKHSLKLIQSLQSKSLKAFGNSINKSNSSSTLNTSQVRQIRRKRKFRQVQQPTSAEELQQNSASQQSAHHKITDLYAMRARNVKYQLQRKYQQHLNEDRHYLKVDGARKRKQQLLLERLQKIRNIQLIQHKLKHSRHASPQSPIYQQVQAQRTEEQNSKRLASKPRYNYKQSIRKQIALFIKNQGLI